MSMNEIERKLRELRELQALIEEVEQEAETIRYAIKEHMGESEELRAGEYKVTWKAVKPQKRMQHDGSQGLCKQVLSG